MRKLLPPVVILLSVISMFIVDYFLPLSQIIHPPWTDIGIIFILIGLYTVFSTSRMIKEEKTEIHTWKTPSKLLTSNLFAFSRNPIYTGFTSLLLGIAICFGSLTPFFFVIFFFGLANFWYIPFEEENMEKLFGDQFMEYKRRVRRWL